MQLGRTIIGGIIGATIGIAVMVALYLSPLRLETVFMALLVAVLTGLGVRMMVATRGHASYLRGAVTAALALGAYLLGWYAVGVYAKQISAKASEASLAALEDGAGDKAVEDGDEAGDEKKAEEGTPLEPPKAAVTQSPPIAGNNKNNPIQTNDAVLLVVLCISALVAYELGRGSAPKPAVVTGDSTPPQGMPQGTHPDA